KSGGPDIFIAAENIGTAMHGDRVVARISRDAPHDRIKGRREGRIIRILERAHDTIVGTLQRSRNFYYVVPDDPRFVHDIYVRPERDQQQGTSANVGDKVVVRLDVWESRHVNPEGEIIEVLGSASAPGVDVLSIIRKYHLPAEFPKDVLDQAERISEKIGSRQLESREDLRKEFIVTIDPDDARDFDDAIQVEKTSTDWRLGVHIADVAAYVILTSPPGDQLGERLHLAWELAALLRRKRFQHGSLDLDFPEVKVWVDKQGNPVRLERVENDESHQLIEEFMLAANEAVARELKN